MADQDIEDQRLANIERAIDDLKNASREANEAIDMLFGFHGRTSPRIGGLHMTAGEDAVEIVGGQVVVKRRK